MATLNQNYFHQRMKLLIKKCYIRVYFYQIFGVAIAFNAIAIQGYLAFNLILENQLYDRNILFLFYSIASILLLTIPAFLWTQQQQELTHEERLDWEKTISLYNETKT